jgi:hypothetical protein
MQLHQVNHDMIDEPDSEDPSLLEEDLVAVLKVCIQYSSSIRLLTRSLSRAPFRRCLVRP